MIEQLIPYFASKNKLLNYLQKNRDALIARKSQMFKRAIAVENDYSIPLYDTQGISKSLVDVFKADLDRTDVKAGELVVPCIINTTNLIDSYLDLHIPKMWNKSIKENAYDLHLESHKMDYDYVISEGDDLKVSVQKYDWKELGAKYEGQTEGLTYLSTIREENNAKMFDRYKKKKVRNHSVGMRYTKIVMCIGNKDYGAEFEAWEKYLPLAVNPEVAEERGYFWAVPEGKNIEGSAVLRGANWITPTLDKVDPLMLEQEVGKSEDDEKKVGAASPLNWAYLTNNF